VLFVGLMIAALVYGVAIIVMAIWPWLVGAAGLVVGWRLVRRYRRRRRAA